MTAVSRRLAAKASLTELESSLSAPSLRFPTSRIALGKDAIVLLRESGNDGSLQKYKFGLLLVMRQSGHALH